MFNFFTALFGGIALGVRYSYEKALDQAFEKKSKSRSEYYKNSIIPYCTEGMEQYILEEEILSGEHYDEICEKFAEDFEFVFGKEWKSILAIPPKPSNLDPRFYGDASYKFVPANHRYWVKWLILAERGKMVSMILGYSISEPNLDWNTRFAQCIEKRLNNAGVNIHLVLGGYTGMRSFVDEGVATGDYQRMWSA